ncbi:hypothetical protein ACFVAD_18390 [Sutcliffiella sp. NPDC057660]|uniref:hypothetical protein n=1 Tax=Sutcliffiella sp. NPDC057660 TaxID=3346199 RepID=UPI0036A368AD
MSIFKSILKGAGKMALEAASQSVSNAKNNMYQQASKSDVKIGGYTIMEWDSQWRYAGILSSLNLTPYNKYVGLYKATLGGKVVYIGKATEWNNGGFRKRLSDYTRESTSARKHGSGQKMHLHRNELNIEFLIVGSNASAAEFTPKLEALMIGKYNPEWNKVKNFNL